MLQELDFVLAFCREMIPGQGEDSFCHSFRDDAGLLAVFDGCGGAGARTHDYYTGRTEAYMASRLCAGAFYDGFRYGTQAPALEALADSALERLKKFTPPQEPGALVMKGSMVRTLPTTAAAAMIRRGSGGRLTVDVLWAGDSRVFVLDGQGLAQLTVDDTSVPDPMENIYEDGILRNIFCSDRTVKRNRVTVELQPPFAVLAATDGCFGYVSTPMEFEGLLLQTLLGAQTPEQWEQALAKAIGSLAGDDHCLCLAAFGYGQFERLKGQVRDRYDHLLRQYLTPVSTLPLEDRKARFALWRQYRDDYFRYRKDGQG